MTTGADDVVEVRCSAGGGPPPPPPPPPSGRLVINEIDYDQVARTPAGSSRSRTPAERPPYSTASRSCSSTVATGPSTNASSYGLARRRRPPVDRRRSPERRAGRCRPDRHGDRDAPRRALVRRRDRHRHHRRTGLRPRRGRCARDERRGLNTVAGSLSRLPDGTDTDDAATDWKFTTTATPGGANVEST